jgi:inositol hexakisphosphate
LIIKKREKNNTRCILFGAWTLLSLLAIISFRVFAADNSGEPTLLRLDLKNPENLSLSNFRTSDGILKTSKDPMPSRLGLSTLKASGSAQFSESGLRQLKKLLKGKKIIDVDLRQESHGFLNELPVSWYGELDMANKGKTLPEVVEDEGLRLQQALQLVKVVATSISRVKGKEVDFSVPIIVKHVATEQELTQTEDVEYFRITATDHTKPNDLDVDRFVEFVKNLPQDTWLHFHCEAGQGRTTTFLVMYDMLRNAKQVSLEDIVRRQWMLGGIDLFQNPSLDNWKYPFALERAEFIKKFYDYAREGTPQSWSTWSKSH